MATNHKLKDVNTILRAVSASPVTNLSSPENMQALIAVDAINEAKESVLLETRWHAVAYDVTLEPVNGKITVDGDKVLALFPKNDTDNFSLRGSTVWNNLTNSDQFTGNLSAVLVYNVDYNDLSPTLRKYIMCYARYNLYLDLIGRGDLAEHYRVEMIKARAKARREDRIGRNPNFIYDNTTGSSIAVRNETARSIREYDYHREN